MTETTRKRRKRHRSIEIEETGGETRSRAIFFLLAFIPIATTLLYGGTSTFALLVIGPLVATLGVLWAVRSWRLSEITLNADPLLYTLLALLALSLFQLLPLGDAAVPADALGTPASNALTLDPFATKLFVLRLSGYILFFAAALTFIDSEARLRKLVSTIAIFGGVIAFVGIIQRLASPDAIYGIRSTPDSIPFGPYFNRHHFASLMVLFSGIVLSHLLGGAVARDKKLLFAIPLVLMAVAIVLTGSRGGVIAYLMTFSLCVAAHLRTGGRTKLPLILGAGAFALLIVFLVIFLGGADALLRSTGLQRAAEDISTGRLHFWSVAWQIFTANPVFGVGMDAFGVAFSRFDTWSGMYRVEQAHNDYLQMLADGGMVGFAITAAFIVLLIRKGAAGLSEDIAGEYQRVTRIGAFAGCVGVLIHSFVDFPLRTASNAFFFLLVVAILAVPDLATHHRRRSANGSGH